jgi:hypothetical protein
LEPREKYIQGIDDIRRKVSWQTSVREENSGFPAASAKFRYDRLARIFN